MGKIIEWIIRLLNSTVLRGYRERRRNSATKVDGNIVTYEDWEADKDWDFADYSKE